MSEGLIEQAVRLTIEGNAPMVQMWLAGQAGSWGFLAGKAALVCREKRGRTLTDWERRKVWHLLWTDLMKLKSEPKTTSNEPGEE